LAPGPRHT